MASKGENFSTERIFSDPKFKLGNAIRATGRAGSDYAERVVAQAVGPRPQAPFGLHA